MCAVIHEIGYFPSKRNLTIYRYMDFDKFESVLNDSSLYFARADKFKDKNEGHLPDKYYDKKYVQKQFRCDEETAKAEARFNKILAGRKRNIFISCWSCGSSESDALWNLFTKTSRGIVIKSNVQSLRNVLDKADGDFLISRVKYFNPKNFRQNINQYWHSHVHKSHIYRHEQELRALFFQIQPPKNRCGFKITVDLDELVHRIIIHPKMHKTFIKDLCNLLKGHPKLEKRLVTSSAYYNPVTEKLF